MSRERGFKLLGIAFVLSLPLVTPNIRGADEIEYFAYLRSAVIDRDLDFDNEYRHFYERDPEGLAGFHATFLGRVEPRTGRRINFAPLGTALLWSPFYLLTHGAVLAGRAAGMSLEADGLSGPYLAAVCYASALYAFLGLVLVYDGLLRFGGASAQHAAGAVLAIWFGTPVLYYTTLAPGFSHACSLFAVSLVVWLSGRLATRPEARVTEWLAAGAAVGMVRSCLGFVLTALDVIRAQSVTSLGNMALFAILVITGTGGEGLVGLAWAWTGACAATAIASFILTLDAIVRLRRASPPIAEPQEI